MLSRCVSDDVFGSDMHPDQQNERAEHPKTNSVLAIRMEDIHQVISRLPERL